MLLLNLRKCFLKAYKQEKLSYKPEDFRKHKKLKLKHLRDQNYEDILIKLTVNILMILFNIIHLNIRMDY